MKESLGSKHGKKTNTQMPSAFELAVLASFTDGNLHKAFQSYSSALEYLKTNGADELALRKGTLSKKKIEAFEKLRSGGALDRGQAVIEYEKLVFGLKPALKLYKDKRDDAVKSAIRAATNRSCNYETARNLVKKAWQLKPSRYTPHGLLAKIKAAKNPWDCWCDAQTAKDKKDDNSRYISITRELLESTLRLLRQHEKREKL